MTLNIALVIITFLVMEGMAWVTHKFVMHGFMWYFHEDHHQPTPGFFEKNDVFFLIYAVPSWLLIMFGMMNGNDFRTFIGFGILAYGIGYFWFMKFLYTEDSAGSTKQTTCIFVPFAKRTRFIIKINSKKKQNVSECLSFHSNTSKLNRDSNKQRLPNESEIRLPFG